MAYSSIKGALRAITKEVAVDVATAGVRVNTVHPGLIHTPIMDSFSKEVTEAVLAKIRSASPPSQSTSPTGCSSCQRRGTVRDRYRHGHRRRIHRRVKPIHHHS
ncbi:SDR family oxidoreductase [Nocardia gipuzkoensis]